MQFSAPAGRQQTTHKKQGCFVYNYSIQTVKSEWNHPYPEKGGKQRP